MTNASMQAFILRRLRPSAMFLRPFEKLTRKLLKAALGCVTFPFTLRLDLHSCLRFRLYMHL